MKNYILYYYKLIKINILTLFYKQSVYKQLALGWQIAMQFLELNPLSLSNNIKTTN